MQIKESCKYTCKIPVITADILAITADILIIIVNILPNCKKV